MRRPTGIVMSVIIALIVGVMLIVFVIQQSKKPNNDINFGQPTVFPAGKISSLSDEIEKRGPILQASLTNGGPDIYLQHTGLDPASGWQAFNAQAGGQGRQCTIQWRAAVRQFVDPCTQQVYPDDGGSLQHYKIVLENGQVNIDFRSPIS
jgi:hypothetical protein